MKKWVEIDRCYELHFTPFYEDIVLLKFVQDKEDSDCWWYTSEELNEEYDCIREDSLEEAKETFEEMILSHYESEEAYYKELKTSFSSEE